MNIETLKIFKDLIETRNYSKTARLNYISQSAVSQQIKKLELVFKGKLFEKTDNDFELTDTGKLLYEAATKITAIYQEMLYKIKTQNLGGKKEELHISAVYTAGLYIVGDYIKAFLNSNPFVKVNLDYKKCSEIVKEVEAGKINFGFIASKSVNNTNIASLHILDDEMVLITYPSCDFKGKYISIKDISKFNLVLFEKNSPSRQYLEKILKDKKVKINVTMEIENIEAIKASVMSNAGVSIVPLVCVKEEEKEGRLKIFRFIEGKIYRPIFLIYNKKKKMSSAASNFLNMMLAIKRNQGGASNGEN